MVMVSIYFISLASNEQNLFDIFHAAYLKQPAFYGQNPFIVGIASGYEEALEMIQRMVDDIYRETGGFQVREYFGDAQYCGTVIGEPDAAYTFRHFENNWYCSGSAFGVVYFNPAAGPLCAHSL